MITNVWEEYTGYNDDKQRTEEKKAIDADLDDMHEGMLEHVGASQGNFDNKETDEDDMIAHSKPMPTVVADKKSTLEETIKSAQGEYDSTYSGQSVHVQDVGNNSPLLGLVNIIQLKRKGCLEHI